MGILNSILLLCNASGGIMKIIILFSAFLLLFSGLVSKPIVKFSSITQCFNSQLPIGEEFDISGSVDNDIAAVKIESYGYFGEHKTHDEISDIIKGNRNTKTLISYIGAWQRESINDAKFTITHPRLYYMRNYAFKVTYYKKIMKEELKMQLSKKIEDLLSKTIIDKSTISNELYKALEEKLLLGNSLSPAKSVISTVVNKKANEIFEFMSLKDKFRTVERLRNNLVKDFMEIQNENEYEDIRNSLMECKEIVKDLTINDLSDASIRAFDSLSKSITSFLNKIDKKQGTHITRLKGFQRGFESFAKDYKKIFSAEESNEDSNIETKLKEYESTLNDDLIDEIYRNIYDKFNKYVMPANSEPYLPTVKERIPFRVSMDGGLQYVWKFQEVVPSIAANLKLCNIKDYNDPKPGTTWPELSLLLGLTLSKPEDMDPDYDGYFDSTGDKALLVGFGARISNLSSLIRLQTGVLFYKQSDVNPQREEKSKEASYFVGISLNWDAVDYFSKQFKTRSQIKF